MSHYTEEIDEIKERLEKAKNSRIRAEARLEQLQRQKDEILAELKQFGIDPGNMEAELETLREEIEHALKALHQLLEEDG